MRAVMVVSSYNEFVDTFVDMAIQPIGVIELSPNQFDALWLTRSKRCETFCSKNGLYYNNVSYANLSTLGQIFERWQTDLVITYSVPILPMYSLSTVSLGGINVHHSPLPAYRGGNPLLWQIMDGQESFGISVHRLNEVVDQGDILGSVVVPRLSGCSKKQLVSDSNRDFGVPLLHQVVTNIVNGDLVGVKQPQASTTDSANHVLPQEFLSVLAGKQVTLEGLWDVACFYSSLPMECVPGGAWRRWLRWVPSRINQPCEKKGCKAAEAYRLVPEGLQLQLTHANGCVVFKPRWHTATFLSRLLL